MAQSAPRSAASLFHSAASLFHSATSLFHSATSLFHSAIADLLFPSALRSSNKNLARPKQRNPRFANTTLPFYYPQDSNDPNFSRHHLGSTIENWIQLSQQHAIKNSSRIQLGNS
ncbi:hypothetical protein O181_013888 [Austropuccinia psidii MF-1]|uniref:Uncharacterized protein n=1 Tax=Austropuccinia psidii MF-1 TaxID=1389203 RepID=A0A9Q3GNJ3_9BASI|nr:hypothetical protein [Austropuccinia psidii MF-1]